jgi:hypothetical protein
MTLCLALPPRLHMVSYLRSSRIFESCGVNYQPHVHYIAVVTLQKLRTFYHKLIVLSIPAKFSKVRPIDLVVNITKCGMSRSRKALGK